MQKKEKTKSEKKKEQNLKSKYHQGQQSFGNQQEPQKKNNTIKGQKENQQK